MAVNFKGGFKVGGVEFIQPLTSDELRFLLTILKKCTFTGDEMENLIIITMKLQKEYKQVLDKEQKIT